MKQYNQELYISPIPYFKINDVPCTLLHFVSSSVLVFQGWEVLQIQHMVSGPTSLGFSSFADAN